MTSALSPSFSVNQFITFEIQQRVNLARQRLFHVLGEWAYEWLVQLCFRTVRFGHIFSEFGPKSEANHSGIRKIWLMVGNTKIPAVPEKVGPFMIHSFTHSPTHTYSHTHTLSLCHSHTHAHARGHTHLLHNHIGMCVTYSSVIS